MKSIAEFYDHFLTILFKFLTDDNPINEQVFITNAMFNYDFLSDVIAGSVD